MARQEHEREDLLAEATALIERVELEVALEPAPVVVGIRRDGCLSIYFGGDPAVHFNSAQELRRAFLMGRLLKAEGRRLVALMRQRTSDAVHLLREELAPAEQQQLLSTFAARVARLRQAIASDGCRVLRCAPAELPARERVRGWLGSLPEAWLVAAVPHAR